MYLTCFRRSRTRCGILYIVGRRGFNYFPLTLLIGVVDRGRLCEYESRVQLVRRLFKPPAAHGYSEDDHLWGKRLTGVGKFSNSPLAREDSNSTPKMLQ